MRPTPSNHSRKAQSLVEKARANGGLAPLDLDKFWADQAVAVRAPFDASIPQMPLGIMMSGECVFDELGVEEDLWRYQADSEWRAAIHKAYNDRSERIVGRRLLGETSDDLTRVYPPLKGLHDIFEARNEWHAGSWWLMRSANSEDELKALLDRVDTRLSDLRPFLLAGNWDEEKERLMALGARPPVYRGQRGPITFAASIYGVENLISLIMTNPDLAARLRDTILRAMLEIARVLDKEAGYTNETAPHGFYFRDDNCYLLTPDMYEFFGYPILEGVFSRYSPNPADLRGQHSDSAMGHLLPILGRLNMTSLNLGPTLTVREIREHCPQAIIYGQLAPFTFSRNEEQKIVEEFLRDFEMTREKRGVVFATAGSINNGSRLTGMRLIMSAIQHFGRFDK